MKFLMALLLLGIQLNLAQAQVENYDPIDKPILVQEDEESNEPKFSTLVKSTMDLLGPVEEIEEVSQIDSVQPQAQVSQAE